ncbi:MAG: hypothetical protein U1A78_02245 [Polyangia bacterium]
MPKHKARTAVGVLVGALLIGTAAGCEPPAPPVLVEKPLELHEVAWNPKGTPVGKVADVAELDEDTLILSDQGALVFTGGVLLASDAGVRDFRAAAVLPAGDRGGDQGGEQTGSWLVALGSDGRLRRLRSRSSLEDISDRYGLKDRKVLGAADLGGGRSAFSLAPAGSPPNPTDPLVDDAAELAVADGDKVLRYTVSLPGLRGGGGRVAGIVKGAQSSQVVVFRPSDGTRAAWSVPEPVALDFLPDGRLIVAAAHALYREAAPDAQNVSDGQLERIHVSEEPIRGLVVSEGAIWLHLGDSLAQLDGQTLRRAPLPMPPDAAAGSRLVSSPSGGVWLNAGGSLRRFAAPGDTLEDSDRWERDVRPMFTRLCSLCHLPNGSAGIDLSTYTSWASRRALLEQRVLVGKPSPMPPAGAGTLTRAEADALRAWLAKK